MEMKLVASSLLVLVYLGLAFGQLCPRKAASATADIKPKLIFYDPKTYHDLKIIPANRRQYTWNDKDVKSFVKSRFNLTQSTLIYTHGFTQSTSYPWLKAMRNRYKQLENPGFNLLFFDWSHESCRSYSTAASLVPNLGKALAQFLIQMNTIYQYNISNVHIISYSLSTHIAGQAGKELKSRAGLTLGQITAIDPTGVCFHKGTSFAQTNMLKPTDASLVVARHYDMFNFGSRQAIGGVDIFVNGGKHQSMASKLLRRTRGISYQDDDSLEHLVGSALSHMKATHHEIVEKSNDCFEVAYQCSSYDAFLAGACGSCGQDGSKCYYVSNLDTAREQSMGINLRSNDYKTNTNMYLKTSKGDSCLQHYQIFLSFEKQPSTALAKQMASGKVQFLLNSGQTAEPNYKVDGGLGYTQLITRKFKLSQPEKVKIQARSSIRKELSSTLNSLQVNFMSHPLESERKKESATFCLTTETSQDSYLVKC